MLDISLRCPIAPSLAGPPSQVLWRPWMRNLAQDLEGFAQVRVTSPPIPETNIAAGTS